MKKSVYRIDEGLEDSPVPVARKQLVVHAAR